MKTVILVLSFLLLLPLHADKPAMEAREALLLARFDTDGDGILSPEERAAAAQTLRREKQEARQARNADINANTQILQRKREIALIQRFDTNGDGVLSPEERARAEQILKQERQGNRAPPRR
jgi:endonuclease/exonuclease/phosphatase (EEP) superfamily protein YafD